MTTKIQMPKRGGRPSGRTAHVYITSGHKMNANGGHRVCPQTSKVRFRNQDDAKQALVGAAYSRGMAMPAEWDDPEFECRRRETRCYWCAACHGWHLTSQPKRATAEMSEGE